MTLYELTLEEAKLLELLEAEEIASDEIKNRVKIINENYEKKAEGYAKILQQIKNNIEIYESEIERLKKRKMILKNNIQRLRETLKNSMLTLNKTKITTPLFTLSIRKTAAKLEIEEGANIPKKFYVEQEPVLNKKELLTTIKNGAEIEGVRLVQSEALFIS